MSHGTSTSQESSLGGPGGVAEPAGGCAETHTLRSSSQPLLGAVIRVVNAQAEPKTFALRSGTCRIGAGRAADIVVRDHAVSRIHAELALQPDGVLVTDLESRNGVYYLGQRVERIILGLGSHFRIGTTDVAVEPDRQLLDQLAPVELTSYGGAIGVSASMRRLFAVLLRLENSLVSVLLQGETGTGKDLIARALHDHSRVAAGPFVAVNCGMIDRALVRSELFGHRRGAFTGALDHCTGAFEAASGGTLFLDEVGELPLDVQPALLRALETRRIVRLGETQERPVKVRVVAATNSDLPAAVERKTFRADLYYRLAVVTLHIAPLRERYEDVEALARHFASELGLGQPAPELLASLAGRPWPGNVRELRNALQAHHALGALEGAADTECESAATSASEIEAAIARWLRPECDYATQKQVLLDTFQRLYLTALLRHTNGNQSEAARISGLQRSYLGQLFNKIARTRP